MPIFSISMLTESPGLSQRGGFCAMPTPCGVPVRMTVPGNNVVLPLRNSINVGVEDHVVGVQSCMVSPLSTNADFKFIRWNLIGRRQNWSTG